MYIEHIMSVQELEGAVMPLQIRFLFPPIHSTLPSKLTMYVQLLHCNMLATYSRLFKMQGEKSKPFMTLECPGVSQKEENN